jgi:hypothetical protein
MVVFGMALGSALVIILGIALVLIITASIAPATAITLTALIIATAIDRRSTIISFYFLCWQKC